MIIIKCAKCGKKIFKYVKIGKGHLWHCWKARIVEDFSIHEGAEIKCTCGNVIGYDVGKYIKLRQGAFVYKGTIK